MLGNIGLITLSIIQIITAIMFLASSKKDEILGMKVLTKELSVYRYLLSSLWISVSLIYLLGAFNTAYFIGATTLGIVNIILEIISYWAGFSKNKNLPKWYPPVGTIVMSIPLILMVLNLLN